MTAEDWKRRSVCVSAACQIQDQRTWSTKRYLEVLRDFANETLEWELANEKLGGFLVTPNLAERNGTRTETMRLLDTTSLCRVDGSGRKSSRATNLNEAQ